MLFINQETGEVRKLEAIPLPEALLATWQPMIDPDTGVDLESGKVDKSLGLLMHEAYILEHGKPSEIKYLITYEFWDDKLNEWIDCKIPNLQLMDKYDIMWYLLNMVDDNGDATTRNVKATPQK